MCVILMVALATRVLVVYLIWLFTVVYKILLKKERKKKDYILESDLDY